jgi:hypothetical protein
MLFLIQLCHAEYHLVAYLVNYLCSHCIHAQGFCSVFLATVMPFKYAVYEYLGM